MLFTYLHNNIKIGILNENVLNTNSITFHFILSFSTSNLPHYHVPLVFFQTIFVPKSFSSIQLQINITKNQKLHQQLFQFIDFYFWQLHMCLPKVTTIRPYKVTVVFIPFLFLISQLIQYFFR